MYMGHNDSSYIPYGYYILFNEYANFFEKNNILIGEKYI